MENETHTCGICKRIGHNKRNCPYPEITKHEIKTVVVLNNDQEANLEIKYKDDVVTIYLDGLFVCEADWTNNMREFLLLALKTWGVVNYNG